MLRSDTSFLSKYFYEETVFGSLVHTVFTFFFIGGVFSCFCFIFIGGVFSCFCFIFLLIKDSYYLVN